MNLERFTRERQAAWAELDSLAATAKRRADHLDPAGVLRLGSLYRSTAADLALARRAFPSEPVVEALQQRVGRARHLVYAAPTRRGAIVQFFTTGYWRAIRERPVPLLIAILVLAGSTGITGVWAYRDPGAAAGLVPGSYAAVTQPRPHGSDLGLPASERSAFAGEIFTNNIRVTLVAFAFGAVAGVGAALILLLNGVMLGAVGGLAIGSGNSSVFFELIVAHGILELSCIAVAAAAGMRLGWALVEPGLESRTRAMTAEAHRAFAIVAGTAPWLVIAGLVEGFLTPAGLSLAEALGIGGSLAALFWTLVLVRGRPAPNARDVLAPSF